MKFYYQLLFLLVTIGSFAQNQLWKGYYSYQETTAVTQDHQTIYFATDNAVFAYNQHSAETEIFNTINGLKIDGITTLAYAVDYKKLIVGSTNGKVAIIDLAADKIYHLNDIFNKTNIPDSQKKVNRIVVHNGYAYLATGYGITAVRLNDNHFGDTFYVGADGDFANVKSIAVTANQMYATVENEGIKKAFLNSNLIDYNNWQVIDFSNWLDLVSIGNQLVGVKEDLTLNTISATNQITQVGEVWGGFLRLNTSGDILLEITHEAVRLRTSDFSVYNEFIFAMNENGGVNDGTFANGMYYVASRTKGGLKIPIENKTAFQNVSPTGPLSNNAFALTFQNRDLWVTFGGYGNGMNPYIPNGLTSYGLSILKNMQNWNEITLSELQNIKSTVNVSFNPQKPNTAYISSFNDGLGVLDVNSKDFTIYDDQNTGALQAIAPDDVRVNGVTFDRNGTGWMTNSGVNPFLVSVDKNNQFNAYSFNLGTFNDSYLSPIIDKNNTKWIGSGLNGVFAFNETKNNKAMQIETRHNLPGRVITALALDYNNQLWIGTEKGLRIVPNVDQFLTTSQLTPTNIVIMDEGKAQELFFEQNILAITVDGSNNKWVSIADSGVFLISGNGQETIYKFTKENSPLPSNDVLSIAIEGTTGEVFFGTRKGIVSFKNYATTPTSNLDQVKVYPNPVKPEFTSDVKITGLVANSNVKITDIAGNLVYETTSLGGSVTWNTYSFSGAKVPSGVYMIFVSSDDGTLDVVKKLMIIR
ncbi:MAG TPA: T9SS type A sorting domain-containing protein [Flavobacterium sp.]|nr:T9SS type A sorting domain-containing protein [Flavobacterium sp.]